MIFVFYDLKKCRSFPSWLSTLYTKESSEFFMCFVSGHIVVLSQNSSMWPQLLSTEAGYSHPTGMPFGLSLAPTPFLSGYLSLHRAHSSCGDGLSSCWLHPPWPCLRGGTSGQATDPNWVHQPLPLGTLSWDQTEHLSLYPSGWTWRA